MTLRLVREPSRYQTTFGIVYVDGHYFAHCLEDQIREVVGQPVASWKVAGQTAIPAGRYRVTVTPSPRFKRDLPLLVDVPGFIGIRIHPLNRADQTEGCIGVGYERSEGEPSSLLESRVACEALQAQIVAAGANGEEVWIDVENPPAQRINS